jgi:hypothetical protein
MELATINHRADNIANQRADYIEWEVTALDLAPPVHAAVKVHDDISDLSFFEPLRVYKAPLQTLDGTKVPNAFALRSTNGDRLVYDTAVTKTYTLENHADLYGKHNDVLKQSDLHNRNVEVRDEYSNFGLKAKRSIKFLDESYDLGNGDLVHARTDIINSVNGVWAFQQFAGAYRSYCENSMVFGGEKAAYNKRKHTKHFNGKALLATSNSVFNTFRDNAEKFMEWKRTPIDTNTAYEFLAHICTGLSSADAKLMANLPADQQQQVKEDALNWKKYRALCDLWDEYSAPYGSKTGQGVGANKWALYNVLTHYATHTHDTRQVENKKGDLVMHSLGRNNPNRMDSKHGGYTLQEQRLRADDVILWTTSPAWHSIH